MTRETKIGLLVGLAFIIVIGILLSDHMTSATEPPKAPLSVAGDNVRESVVTPAAPQAAPAVAAVAGQAGGAVTPRQTVNVGGDLSQPARSNPPAVVIGPAPQPGQGPVVLQQGPAVQPQPQAQPQSQPPAEVTQAAPPVVVDPPVTAPPVTQQQPQLQPPRSARHALETLALRHGEQIVPLRDPGTGASQPPTPVRPAPVPMGTLREYKAQSGDSLSKLAVKFMGSSSKANRDAIIRMNPSLQMNPDKVVEGRTYVLPPPPAPADVAAAPTTPAPVPTPARETSATEVRATAPSQNFSWYTVKENENLWKIASEQLGSGNAWTQIRDLNQDILKGEDQVRVNTRIRIPNKPVASVAH